MLITRPVSEIAGIWADSSLSKGKIASFIRNNNIDMSDYVKRDYMSFNEFFCRKIKKDRRPFSENPQDFISVADSKLSVYNIDKNLHINIKNSVYTVASLLENYKLSEKFVGGLCLVFRLDPTDYHRYCFFDSGKILSRKKIKGKLHTVMPIAEKHQVYAKNSREYAVLKTDNFGLVVQAEVGAMVVGRIVNRDIADFKKGSEKGYFEFGGSTVVVLLQKDTANIDEDILEKSKNFIETKVKYGEKIGVRF